MKLLLCLLLGSGLLPACATALPPQAGTPPSNHTPRLATDAQAAVPEVGYVSALSAYAPAAARTAAPDQLWLESNRALAASGGMAGMAGMAHAPAGASHQHGAAASASASVGASTAAVKPVAPAAIRPASDSTPKPAIEPAMQPQDQVEAKMHHPMQTPMEMPMDHMHHQGM